MITTGITKDQIQEEKLNKILRNLKVLGIHRDGNILQVYMDSSHKIVKDIIEEGIHMETLSESKMEWKRNFEKIKIELEKKIKEEYEEKEIQLKKENNIGLIESERLELEQLRREKAERI